MPELRHVAVVVFGLCVGISAQADDGYTNLDAVDTGHTRSLDAYDKGSTRSLDGVDEGKTVDQDALDDGHTTSLDKADTGRTVDFNRVDDGSTESLSAAEAPPKAAPSLPPPLPAIANDGLREKALNARAALVAAEQRSTAADAAYSEMRAHDFPRGEAAAAIEKEYEAAHTAYEQANAHYTEILQKVNPAAIDD